MCNNIIVRIIRMNETKDLLSDIIDCIHLYISHANGMSTGSHNKWTIAGFTESHKLQTPKGK